MKHLLVLLFISMSCILTGCSKETPEQVALKVVKALDNMDFDSVKKNSTDKIKNKIINIETYRQENVENKFVKREDPWKNIKREYRIEEYTEMYENEGKKSAVVHIECTYTQNDKSSKFSQRIELEEIDGKWLIRYFPGL